MELTSKIFVHFAKNSLSSKNLPQWQFDLDIKIDFNLAAIIYSKASRLGQAIGTPWNLGAKSYLIKVSKIHDLVSRSTDL